MRHGDDIDRELRAWLSGSERVVVAGIGNTIRQDDGVGVVIVASLKGKVSSAITLIECETAPESFVDEIADIAPSHVLLVDAAMLDLPPGDVRLCGPEDVLHARGVSTHALPLRVFCEYVEKLTGATVALLLVQPKMTDFGEGLTPELEEAAERTARVLRGCLP